MHKSGYKRLLPSAGWGDGKCSRGGMPCRWGSMSGGYKAALRADTILYILDDTAGSDAVPVGIRQKNLYTGGRLWYS